MPGVAKCSWLDIYYDDDGSTKSEHCISGKPATFRNCGFTMPVCEDHKCRCGEPGQSPFAPRGSLPGSIDEPYPTYPLYGIIGPGAYPYPLHSSGLGSSPEEHEARLRWAEAWRESERWRRKAETERDAAVAALAATRGHAIDDATVRLSVTSLGSIVVHLRSELPTEAKRIVSMLAPVLAWLYPGPGETKALRAYDAERSRRVAAETENARLRDAIRDSLQRWSATTGDGSMWGDDAHVLGPLRAAMDGEI